MPDGDELSIFVGRRGARYSDPEEWRSLILEERLRRGDVVAVRRAGVTTYHPAGDVPELRELFKEVERPGSADIETFAAAPAPPAAGGRSDLAPPAPPRATSAVPTTPPPGFGATPGSQVGKVDPSAAPATPPWLPQPRPGAPPPPPPRDRPPRRRGAGCLWITLLIAGVSVFLFLRGCPPHPRDAGTSAETVGAVSTEPVTRYVTRTSRVRSRPSASASPPVAELRRGERVTGVLTNGAAGPASWLRFTRGPYEDRYVWAANLSERRPPSLSRAGSGRRVAARSGELLSRPAFDAARVRTVSAGDRLHVAGTVADGWLEILRPAGGVAYLRAETLLGPEAPEETAVAPAGLFDDTGETEPPPDVR